MSKDASKMRGSGNVTPFHGTYTPPPGGDPPDDMERRLSAVEKAVELMSADMRVVRETLIRLEAKFDVVDQRFNAVDQRFNAVDQRFSAIDETVKSLPSVGDFWKVSLSVAAVLLISAYLMLLTPQGRAFLALLAGLGNPT